MEILRFPKKMFIFFNLLSNHPRLLPFTVNLCNTEWFQCYTCPAGNRPRGRPLDTRTA